MMGASGILGEYKGSQAREVTMTLKEYEQVRGQMQADKAAGYQDMAEEEHENNETKEHEYINEGQKEYLAIDSEQD